VLLYSQNDIQLFGKVPGPPIEHALEVNFGDLIRLLGYTLHTEKIKAGDNLQLTLYWQALAEMSTSYHVFTHLIDENDRLLGQKDGLPMSGTYPTTKWRAGEIIVDGYELLVPPDTLPGRYLIETGLYELSTGQRLPVLDAAGTPQDSRGILGKVRVVGG
jgi:lipoteichoic acid synthase